jgi:PST family polysaccharide transporter
MSKLSVRTFSALRWGYLGYVVRAFSGLAIGIVLARILGPKPFGQVAAAMLVFGLANLLADGGFGSAIIQSQELGDEDIRFAYSCQIVLGGILTALCVIISHEASVFLRDPAIENVLRVTSCVFIIQAIGQTSTALLKRRLEFRLLQIGQIVTYLFGYAIVGILLASKGAGVWSLVAAQITTSTVGTLWVISVARHPMIPGWNKPRWRLAHFGVKVTGANIMNYGISNLDNAVVGHAFGSFALGLYSRAFNTVSSPSDAVVGTWQQVLFASCSRAQNKRESISRAYLASVALMALIMFPVFWGVSAAAPAVVLGTYGVRWIEAAPLLRPLAIAITINAIMALTGPILTAVNQVKRELTTQCQALLVTIPVFIVCCHYSATVLAWGVLGVYLVRFWTVVRQGLQVMNLKWKDILLELRGGVVIGLLTITSILLIEHVFRYYTGHPTYLLFALCAGGSIPLVFLLYFMPDFIMSRNMVYMLKLVSGSLPEPIASWAGSIDRRQQDRDEFDRRNRTSLRYHAGSRTIGGIYIAMQLSSFGITGVHTHIAELIKYLRTIDIHAQLITPYGAPRVLRRSIGLLSRFAWLFSRRYSRIASIFAVRWLLGYQMRSVLPRDAPWTVYAQCPPSALIAARRRRTSLQTVVLVVHFNISQADEMVAQGVISRNGWIYRSVWRWEEKGLLAADRIVFVSDFMRQCLMERIPALRGRPYLVLPNFVTTPEAAKNGPEGDIITIGSLEPRKNHEYILRVLSQAKIYGDEYSLTIVGSGDGENRLRAIAEELGVVDQVTFTGFIPNASGLLSRFRLYAHAAVLENLPLVIIEAMAAGVPAVAGRVGGIAEILVDNVTGCFWDLSDVSSGARVLTDLLKDEDRMKSMGAAAVERFRNEYSADIVAPKLWNFLCGVTGEGDM